MPPLAKVLCKFHYSPNAFFCHRKSWPRAREARKQTSHGVTELCALGVQCIFRVKTHVARRYQALNFLCATAKRKEKEEIYIVVIFCLDFEQFDQCQIHVHNMRFLKNCKCGSEIYPTQPKTHIMYFPVGNAGHSYRLRCA